MTNNIDKDLEDPLPQQQKLAELLHDMTKGSSKQIKEVFDKIQKAALNGESSIKVKCSEQDFKLVKEPRKFNYETAKYEDKPLTNLLEKLKEEGFHLEIDYEITLFFGNKRWLIISW